LLDTGSPFSFLTPEALLAGMGPNFMSKNIVSMKVNGI
jgi:hypothetical protein